MLLEVHERLALIQILPSQGDFKALKTIRRAKEMLSFTPEEMETLKLDNIKGADGQIRVNWDASKANQVVKDCPIDEYTTNLFIEELAKMNQEGRLTEQTMSIYEKFVVLYK